MVYISMAEMLRQRRQAANKQEQSWAQA